LAQFQKGIGARPEIDACFTHARRQPVMLVQGKLVPKRADKGHADEHLAPLLVVDVEVVLYHQALCDLQRPASEARRGSPGKPAGSC
jgi:hypothetical protein